MSVEPNRVDALSNRAIALNALGRHDEALSDCDRAISIRPDYPTAFVTRGNVLHGKERYDEALANYDRALALRPQPATVQPRLMNSSVRARPRPRLQPVMRTVFGFIPP